MIGADRDPLRFHFEPHNQGVALPSPGVNLRCRSTLASFYGPAMTLSETASRFDLSAAWFNALAERASMQTLESLDFAKVHRHNQWLARAMREALLAHSIPFEDHGIERGSTIFATAPSSPDAAERLKSAGVVAAMRSYFFHTRTERRMFWDRTGLDLPDFWRATDEEMANALWHEAFAKHVAVGRSLLITDESDTVVFVAAF